MREEEIRKREVFNKYLEMVRIDILNFFSATNNFLTIPCVACKSTEHVIEFKKNSFTYVSCHDCGTLFVNPRPDFSTLINFYKDSPSGNFWINDFFLPVAEARREKIFFPRAKYIYDRFGNKKNAVIGDIGAGFGLFIEELQKMWDEAELLAIEPSLEQAKLCKSKGLSVICSSLEEIEGYENHFDILTSFELLEHLHEIESFLDKIYRMLKNDGIFVFTTLNGKGFDLLQLWEKSKSINPPHHLNFFNVESIEIALKKAGFKHIEVNTPGKLDWDILEGMYSNEEEDIGRFWEYVSKYRDEECKEDLQKWICKHNLSSHMRVICYK